MFAVALELVQKLKGNNRKKEKSRGRASIYPDHLYLSLLILRSYYNWTYRQTADIFRDLFPGEACPSFQALHWYNRKRLKEEELKELLELLKEKLGPSP